MTREEVKEWLLSKTESIDQTDIEKQSMTGGDVIDLMTDLVKESDSVEQLVSDKKFVDKGVINLTYEDIVYLILSNEFIDSSKKIKGVSKLISSMM